MRRPDAEPDGAIPATGGRTGPSEPVHRTGPSEPGTSTGPRPEPGDRNPVEVLTAPSTRTQRRVPVAVLAGVDWLRLMERS